MESEAFSSAIRRRLTSLANITTFLAAVSMCVKGMVGRILFSTWGLVESDSSYEINNLVAEDFRLNNIREYNGLEVHDASI
jgi:hypothetical protein